MSSAFDASEPLDLQSDSNRATRLSVFIQVLRRDIVFAVLPVLVSLILVLTHPSHTLAVVLRSPDLVFATIVFLGLTITQSSEALRSRKPSNKDNEHLLNTQVGVFVLLVASVLVLGLFLLKSKEQGSTPPQQGGDLHPMIPDGYGSLITLETLLFALSVWLLFKINFKKETTRSRRDSYQVSATREELIETCQESVHHALERIQHLHAGLSDATVKQRLRAGVAGIDSEGDRLRGDLRLLFEYTEHLERLAEDFVGAQDVLPSIRNRTSKDRTPRLDGQTNSVPHAERTQAH